MKKVVKKKIGVIRLNSFKPLCISEIGKIAEKNYSISPFIDGSCRREPDLENSYPSITALCRKGKFAPHLNVNDIIVYITVKGKWNCNFEHYRLVAILEVIHKEGNHIQAAEWYKKRNVVIPSNCMVNNNSAIQFDKTSGNYKNKSMIKEFLQLTPEKQERTGKIKIKNWDREYLNRSQQWGNFVITQPIFINIENPPILTVENLRFIFGKIPGTQNPKKITKEELNSLAKYADIYFECD